MRVDISHGAVTAKTENVVASEVVLKKNLWYLDGAELLDGSRLLNAFDYEGGIVKYGCCCNKKSEK